VLPALPALPEGGGSVVSPPEQATSSEERRREERRRMEEVPFGKGFLLDGRRVRI
jgi:hypothetical protein